MKQFLFKDHGIWQWKQGKSEASKLPIGLIHAYCTATALRPYALLLCILGIVIEANGRYQIFVDLEDVALRVASRVALKEGLRFPEHCYLSSFQPRKHCSGGFFQSWTLP